MTLGHFLSLLSLLLSYSILQASTVCAHCSKILNTKSNTYFLEGCAQNIHLFYVNIPNANYLMCDANDFFILSLMSYKIVYAMKFSTCLTNLLWFIHGSCSPLKDYSSNSVEFSSLRAEETLIAS